MRTITSALAAAASVLSDTFPVNVGTASPQDWATFKTNKYRYTPGFNRVSQKKRRIKARQQQSGRRKHVNTHKKSR